MQGEHNRALTLRKYAGLSDVHHLEEEWRALATSTGADIYLTPGWVMTWCSVFSKTEDLQLYAFYDGAKLVGITPFVVERIGPFRCARLAGTDHYSVLFRLPVIESYLPDVLQQASFELINRSRNADFVSFSPVSALSQIAQNLSCFSNSKDLVCKTSPKGTHTVFDLPAEFDDYLKSISKKRRGQFRRDMKALSAEFDIEPVSRHPEEGDVQKFAELHRQQWNALGKGGYFSDWPGSYELYSALARDPDTNKAVTIDWIDSRGSPLAAQLCIGTGDTAHWRLPARVTSAELERHSLGKVGLILMLKRLIADGVRRVEAGLGDYGYKLNYGAKTVAVDSVVIHGNTSGAGLRYFLVLKWADLINLLYYRIWFLKLIPRLSLKPRPLWSVWIRSRL